MEKNIYIKTFGCQMNQYDSDRIFDSLKNIGYKKTNVQNGAFVTSQMLKIACFLPKSQF